MECGENTTDTVYLCDCCEVREGGDLGVVKGEEETPSTWGNIFDRASLPCAGIL